MESEEAWGGHGEDVAKRSLCQPVWKLREQASLEKGQEKRKEAWK